MSRTKTFRKNTKRFDCHGRNVPWIQRPYGVEGDEEFVLVFILAGFVDRDGSVLSLSKAYELKKYMPKAVWWAQIGQKLNDRKWGGFGYWENRLDRADRRATKIALKRASVDWESYQDPSFHFDRNDKYFD